MPPGQEAGMGAPMQPNAPMEPAPAAATPQGDGGPQVTIGEIVPDDEKGFNQ